jgi:hypothetical protein
MWLITTFGFFSIVQKPEDEARGTLTIRARVRNDLKVLKQSYIPNLGPIQVSDNTDYRYRAIATKSEVADAMCRAIAELDYSNFKSRVEQLQGGMRAKLYHEVWHALYALQSDPAFDPPEPKADSYGGVVMSGGGKVLLRAPANQHGGYAWTFAKTAAAPGDTPEKAAMVAVYQKTGYVGRIRAEIPGLFKGEDSLSCYFLMEVDYRASEPNWQTSGLRWATLDEARDLVRLSSNEDGRNRDLAILDAAEATLKTIPHREHLSVQAEDWSDLQAMPGRNIVLQPRLWYSQEDMTAIRRGFYPTVMEQKWFLIFTGDRLRMHRSWTGNLIFDVGFTFDPQGGAYVSDVIVNRDPEQYQCTDSDEDLSLMKDLIQGHLLEPLDAPAVDGFVLALQEASKPNYLGSPTVVGDLVASLLNAVVRDFNTEEEAIIEDVPPENSRGVIVQKVVAALSGMDNAYTSMPSWHGTTELGRHIMKYIAPKVSFNGFESLFELVSEAAKLVMGKAFELLLAYREDPRATWDEHGQAQLGTLQQYVTAVMLGTNSVTYGEKTLDDIHWETAR